MMNIRVCHRPYSAGSYLRAPEAPDATDVGEGCDKTALADHLQVDRQDPQDDEADVFLSVFVPKVGARDEEDEKEGDVEAIEQQYEAEKQQVKVGSFLLRPVEHVLSVGRRSKPVLFCFGTIPPAWCVCACVCACVCVWCAKVSKRRSLSVSSWSFGFFSSTLLSMTVVNPRISHSYSPVFVQKGPPGEFLVVSQRCHLIAHSPLAPPGVVNFFHHATCNECVANCEDLAFKNVVE